MNSNERKYYLLLSFVEQNSLGNFCSPPGLMNVVEWGIEWRVPGTALGFSDVELSNKNYVWNTIYSLINLSLSDCKLLKETDCFPQCLVLDSKHGLPSINIVRHLMDWGHSRKRIKKRGTVRQHMRKVLILKCTNLLPFPTCYHNPYVFLLANLFAWQHCKAYWRELVIFPLSY